MKKIVLIGDSIRLGYDVLVKEAFTGKAEVFFPQENCRFAAYVLRNLHVWQKEMQCGTDIDCIHWNVGAWDTINLYNEGPFTRLPVYQDYLERICRRIQLLFPNAAPIFATSTPMHEALFTEPEIAIRRNSDVIAYNEAALEVVQKFGHTVNDLYSLMASRPLSDHSDTSHFYTRSGASVLTEQVCRSIGECINVTAAPIDYDAWFPKTDSYEGNAWLAFRDQALQKQNAMDPKKNTLGC